MTGTPSFAKVIHFWCIVYSSQKFFIALSKTSYTVEIYLKAFDTKLTEVYTSLILGKQSIWNGSCLCLAGSAMLMCTEHAIRSL